MGLVASESEYHIPFLDSLDVAILLLLSSKLLLTRLASSSSLFAIVVVLLRTGIIHWLAGPGLGNACPSRS